MSKSPLQLLRARPSDRWKWVLPSSILVLLSFLSAIRHDGPAALSLRSPVHETVAECRTDPDCIPSLKELVTRAAQRCAREASCVCDWNKDAKGCFMKEISRHSDLLQEAKALERLIEEREEIREQKQMLKRKLEGEQAKIASLIDRGKRNVKLHDFTDAERDARKAITVNKLVKRLNAAAKLHSGPSIRRQDVKINQFVGQLQAARRGLRRRRGDETIQHEIKKLSSSIQHISDEVRQVGSYVQDASVREKKEKEERETKKDLRALVQKISGIVGSLRKRKEVIEQASSLETTEKKFADAIAEGEKAVALNDDQHAVAHLPVLLLLARPPSRHFLSYPRPIFLPQTSFGSSPRSFSSAHVTGQEHFLHEAQRLHLQLMDEQHLSSSSPCRACDALAQTIQRS